VGLLPATDEVVLPLWFRLGARVRGVAVPLGLAGIGAALVGNIVLPAVWFPNTAAVALCLGGFVALVVGMVMTFIPGAPTVATRAVASPVTGRWLSVNSPATRVPSHGVHSLGQTFAIDLVYEPKQGARPAFGKGRSFRPSQDFPGFGQPLFAPAAGRVVAVRDSARDHRSRSSWPAIIYMMLEAMIRELAGPRHVLGNHIVLDLGEEAFAAFAHLQHRSATVCVGQQVQAGQLLGRCGNTGNSSEPHLHFQLMDHPRVVLAAGLPFAFTDISINGFALQQGVPATGEIMQSSSAGLSGSQASTQSDQP
jgi:hypothetical protein